ncbi:MAG TPA: T9SS type A sorting domain-containing protein, partial [Chitinophagaceae bacterium]|nr:T9SS type A sorting domain-containing protein [Chitinophagaceae bacterium]
DTASSSYTAVYIDTTTINISTGCIVTSTTNPQTIDESVSIIPNPVTGSSFTLIVETNYVVSNMPVLIYDGKGSLVMQLKETKGTGKKTIDLPAGKLLKGSYFIRVMNGSKIIGTAELLRL